MLSSNMKPVACRIPADAGANASFSKVSNVTMMNRKAHPPSQVKDKEKSKLLESLSATSRREMLHLTATSVGLLHLLLPASAEAASRNATMKQKILKKLEEMRQKFGFSKPKVEGEENKPEAETEGKAKVHNDTKDANPKPKDESEAKPKVHNGLKEMKPEAKDEKRHISTARELKEAPSEGATIPALPGIINGKSAETTLP